MRFFFIFALALLLLACTPTTPVASYASENVIELKYEAYNATPTLTAEARELAIQHCAKFSKFANYKGGRTISMISAEEVHQFVCEETKTDDSALIAAQSKASEYIPIIIYGR